MRNVVVGLLRKIESYQPFSESEAWGLYRIIALAEAVGWSLLIAGIAIQHTHWPVHQYAVPIAGQLHGTIFLIYYAVNIVIYGSLRWSRTKMFLALASGVPPFGTLVFEQYAAHARVARFRKIHHTNIARILLTEAAV